ncbi:MAG: PspC domain-containing protein [Capsulimonadaceae bacterium]
MYCIKCGIEIPTEAAFCPACGQARYSGAQVDDPGEVMSITPGMLQRITEKPPAPSSSAIAEIPGVLAHPGPAAATPSAVRKALVEAIDPDEPDPFAGRTLTRPVAGRVLGGVCAGMAAYFGGTPAAFRIGWTLLTIATVGLLAIAYLVLWKVIPPEA